MSSYSAVAVKQISEKLHWAARCLARIEAKDVGFYDVQDNFWGFLTALQQSWNYFYRLVAESNPEQSKRQTEEKAKLLIERFKQDELDQKEKKVFLTCNSKFLTMDGKLLYKKKTKHVYNTRRVFPGTWLLTIQLYATPRIVLVPRHLCVGEKNGNPCLKIHFSERDIVFYKDVIGEYYKPGIYRFLC